MTIDDLIEQGVEIQGRVWVGGYAADGTAEFEFFAGNDGIVAPGSKGGANWPGREIKYIYAAPGGELRIEVECDDLYKEA